MTGRKAELEAGLLSRTVGTGKLETGQRGQGGEDTERTGQLEQDKRNKVVGT
jgi:hypothetical protein